MSYHRGRDFPGNCGVRGRAAVYWNREDVALRRWPAARDRDRVPAVFPFLVGRARHTTESPGRMVSPGARWPGNDPEAVLAEVAEMCLAGRWSLCSDMV